MITIDRVHGIRRGDDLGSIEPGKQTDLAIGDLDHPYLTPYPDPVFGLIYGAQGFEVETVVCAGDLVMHDREILTLDGSLDSVLTDASLAADAVFERAGVE